MKQWFKKHDFYDWCLLGNFSMMILAWILAYKGWKHLADACLIAQMTFAVAGVSHLLGRFKGEAEERNRCLEIINRVWAEHTPPEPVRPVRRKPKLTIVKNSTCTNAGKGIQ